MDNYNMQKEVGEAIQAGERARASLLDAQKKLGNARNWGIVDMFGGGFFTDMLKHSNMNDASDLIERAKHDLLSFKRELQDVNQVMNLNLNIGDFLTFADFFFDGLIADYMVQSKIATARKQVADAIQQVDVMLRTLQQY